MSGGFLDALTGRRLGGALLVLGGVVIAAIVLWPGGDRERAAPKIQPTRLVSVPQLGLALAHPRAWKRTVAGRVIRLRSPDRAAVLTFSSPLRGRQTRRVKQALERALRKRLAPATIVRDGPGRLGARRVTTFELEGFDGDAVRALAIVDSTPYRTYAVTLLTPARPSAKRLAEVEQILATVRFAKPTPAPKRRRT